MKNSILIMRMAVGMAICQLPLSLFGGAVVGSTEFTQIANNVQLGASYSVYLQQLQEQMNAAQSLLSQYNVMLRNIESLPARDWSSAVDTINRVKQITEQARGFAYAASSAADLFKAQHPSFSQYKSGDKSKEFTEAYADWNTEVNESIETTTGVLQQHIAGFDATGDLIKQLKSDSITADGQKAAIQAGNNFAAVQAEQLLLLRQLQTAQIQQQQTVLAAEKSAEAAKLASEQKAFGVKQTKIGKEKSY